MARARHSQPKAIKYRAWIFVVSWPMMGISISNARPPPEKNNAVAGIVNFMRNIGSSVGTSLVTTLIARRSQYHQEILAGNARADSPNFQNAANGLAQHLNRSGLGAHEAKMRAYATIYRGVQAQAGSLAYIDTFMVLAVGAAIMFFLAFILRKNNPGGGGEIAVG